MPTICTKRVNFASNIAMKKTIQLILILIFFWTIPTVQAQSVESPFLLQLGKTPISLSEAFTVSVTIPNAENIPAIVFPELKGFQKRGTSRTGVTKIVAGKTSETNTFTQNYYALKEGIYAVEPFVVLVNGQSVRSEATKVIVGKNDPNAEILSNEVLDLELEKQTNENLFLTASVRKQSVYVGEGFNLVLSFWVSENNSTALDFYETEKQIEKILQQLKPANCWEENFGIKEIQAIPLAVRNKRFTEYRIYQATFYPLNNQPIQIPAVGLTMKIGETKEKTELKTFYSKPVQVVVRNLPPHPLKNKVAVGNLRLEERINTTNLTTGNSYQYDFKIVGEGNISAIQIPVLENNGSLFDIYPPDVEQRILRQNGRVTGHQSFHYQFIPKQSGAFSLGNFFEWPFFNTVTEKYDTLRSALTVKVGGQALASTPITNQNESSFYTIIDQLEGNTPTTDYQSILKTITNFLIISMLLGMIYIFRKNG
ncbi:MAG: hypothetical protein EAZ32_09570 [Cytophagia bacterium]|nr:MAG: hypothetical protein EAZ46_05270 [Runella sp.]TAG18921.1 MAG: hypothetical protein EAZ38_13555 [Cytophagales bacterium]TAG39567.1 MAG: hypothetical protein EAZ32_09570 [Cytophagia bacterium]TAG52453.1 MAG: hypothetical protein EAZ29_07530 [Runella slithyformis]TAG81165.1 MAG: hypothetical protein EAZ22_07860 [Cytophagales bacterium]